MSGVVAGETQKTHTGIPVLHAGSHFRHGLLQLMIHTIDPMHDGKSHLKPIFFRNGSLDDINKGTSINNVSSIFGFLYPPPSPCPQFSL